ncbi:MAG TPA: choice-of-anchor Q domain-containing protein [Dokdonella sp.]|uniref:choice-of-anchor Q domain-containing protein n=1 Tax=Dokdonella sp. TaxID=2291710 RepID=UPI002C313F39|nr:choice-of-anchor Q domain-containing protein [Dokdonella sp.]HUD40501.1 choice-of-anchor Q domain-containing protein [Dokdonella sp.]
MRPFRFASVPFRILVAVALAAAAPALIAATLPVGHCLDDGSADSLRGVLAVAESGDLVDLRNLTCTSITLDQGPLELGSLEDVGPDAPPFDLTLAGPGPDRLAIRGTDEDYLIFALHYTGTLTLEGLSLSDGRSPPSNLLGAPGVGGCVFAIQSVTLRNVEVHRCTAQYGSGVLSYLGDLIVEDSRIHDNNGELYAASGQVAGAGLMAMQGHSQGRGFVHLLRTEVYANTASGTAVLGAGVFAHNSLSLTDSVLRDNRAISPGGQGAQGGGALANLDITITRSRIHGNSVSGGSVGMGGALFGSGTLTLTDSAVYDNRAAGSNQVFGGAVHVSNAAAGAAPSRIVNSTVSGNRAEFDFGGGSSEALSLDLLHDGPLRAGFAAVEVPAGLPPAGGGGLSLWAPVEIDHATIAFNQSSGSGGGILHIARFSTYTVALNDSIVAANQAPAGRDIAGAEQATLPSVVTGSRNIVRSSGPTVTLPADTLDADPRLLPLADNGGPTPTHELRFDSPARDAGGNPAGLAFDQRGPGFPRELGGAADIGAYELDVETTRYVVTVSTTAGGTVDPSAPQSIVPGESAVLTLTPDAGFQVLAVGGSCGGTRQGAVYTTAPVVADCTVEVSFIDTAMMPVAQVAPGELDLTLGQGSSTGSALSIANVGTGSLDWTIHASTAPGAQPPPAPRPASATARLGSGPPATTAARPALPRGSLALSQTSELTPSPQNSAACYEPDLYTTENRYFRRFYLHEHDVGPALAIESVDVGVESSTGLELTVNLYTLPADTAPETIPLEGLVPIGSGRVYALGGSALTTVRVPIAAIVADTAVHDLIVEVVAPSGVDSGAFFYIGSTPSPETHASFMMAPECNIDEPTRTAGLGFPNMHLILVVNVDEEAPLLPGCDNPADIPWLSVTPAAGSVAAGQTGTATVGVDAAELAIGEYSAVVCVASNDVAGRPLIEVPIHVTVTERTDVPVADVTPASFTFEAVEGTTIDEAILVGNIGTAPLTFQVHTAAGRPRPALAGAKSDAPVPGELHASGLPAATAAAPVAGAAPAGSIPIAQTTDLLPAASNSIACGLSGAYTAVNSYYRRFTFTDHPQIGAYGEVVSVDVAVEASNGMTIAVNLYTLPSGVPAGTIPLGQLALIGSAQADVAAGSALTSISVPVTGTVADTAASDLVVEVATPDGSADEHYFYVGSTPSPQSRPSFMMAPNCGITQPATTASLGRPDMHLILVVHMVPEPVEPLACDDPATIPWLALDSAGGSVAPQDVQPVALGVETTGLAPGEHRARLCLTTDDPLQPRIEIPVRLAITATDCVFGYDFETGENRCAGGTAPPVSLVHSGPLERTIAKTHAGTSVDWLTGTILDAQRDDFAFNAYFDGQRIAFWWPRAAAGGVDAGIAPHPASGEYRILRRGDRVGPAATFSAVSAPGSVGWGAGAEGYLGLRLACAAPGGVCYGYVHLRTGTDGGFPASIVDYAYDPTGRPVRIP